MLTDENGTQYYNLEDVKNVLEKSRSVVLRLLADKNVPKFKFDGDKRRYYRAKDILALKNRPRTVRQVSGTPIEDEEPDTSRQPAA